jgi:hypothetical protein
MSPNPPYRSSHDDLAAIESSLVALLCGEVDSVDEALMTHHRHTASSGQSELAPDASSRQRWWVALRRAGRWLTQRGLPGPWRRRDPPVPAWASLLAAKQAHDGTQVGVISHALILDGCTLNVAGYLPADLRQLDQGVEAIELVIDAPGGSLRTSVEPAPWLAACAGFRAALLLTDVVVDRISAAADPMPIQLDHGGQPYPLVPIPGCDAAPNGEVMDVVPPLPGTALRFELVIGTTLCLAVREVEPEVEVTSLTAVDGGLHLRLDPSTGMAGHVEHGVSAVWLERRGSSGAEPRLDLQRRESGWQLDPSTIEQSVGGSEGNPELWDLWAECRGPQGSWRTRPGRRRSDLLALREAAVLPAARSTLPRGQLKLTPYFTISRHLAVKIRVIPSPPDEGGVPNGKVPG